MTIQELTREEKVLLECLKTEYDGSAIQVFEDEEPAARSLIEKGLLLEDFSPNNKCLMVYLADSPQKSLSIKELIDIQPTSVAKSKLIKIVWALSNVLDGENEGDIHSMTGLPEKDCKKIYDISTECMKYTFNN